jgi:pilus assembly protein CpaF
VLGLGPLEPLLRDPSVSEIMVNAPDRVFYERNGKITLSPARFRDSEHVMRIIDRIVAPTGRRLDESSPMVDARLPDGSRVNVVVPPIAPDCPVLTIRKFRQDKLKIDDLIASGSMTRALADFILACVRGKLNVIISGGTGTGKTTLLNALSAAIPDGERIVTIEDPTELRLQQLHVVTLEARPPGLEGRNAVTQRDLVRNALRMRPDRIIIGEVRGPEAFDMLQAMNTGHDGSISTVHANTPRDALARIENMVLMANLDLPVRAIREQVASAVDLIIQVTRHPDGGRRITYVTEVAGMEGDVITAQDVFRFEQRGVDPDGRLIGDFVASGIRPGFMAKLEDNGIRLPHEVFGIREWTS